jgi:hypothetical protein
MKKSELRQLIKEEINNLLFNEYRFIELLEKIVPPHAFPDGDKFKVIEFIKRGNPSVNYLENMIKLMNKYSNKNISLSQFYSKPTQITPIKASDIPLKTPKESNKKTIVREFLREGKIMTNQKFITIPKPRIKPAPQKPRKNCR